MGQKGGAVSLAGSAEQGAVEGAGGVRVAEDSVDEDSPAYWLCQKVVFSLGEIGTPEAREHLRRMTTLSWPDVVRWHAAVELGVEDELGFDEEQMLR